MLTQRFASIALLAFALAAPAAAADRAPFDRIVVFGTSLSDPGNAFALRGGTNTPPDYSVDPFLVPDRPYARGGHHFSNGATWVEQFAQRLGLAASANPALRGADNRATNYAVGGARARDDGMNFNLGTQVDQFLADAGGAAPSSALFVIEMGGNDLRDALVAGLTGGPAAAQAVVEAAVGAIAGNIMRLYAAGARNFLVWNAPDIGLTPAISGAGGASAANQLVQGFNGGLDQTLAGLAQALPGVQFTRLDVYAKLNTIVAQPQLFGLSNVTAACITPSVAPFSCKPANEFLFWDGIHPTRAGHGIIAQEAESVLAP
jgi:phospholipase/lecithinase/hemolysin